MESVQFKSALGIIEITGDVEDVQAIGIHEEQQIKKQLIPKVLEGSQTTFTFLMNPKETEFQKQIWNILKIIPFGKTLPYLEVTQIYSNTKAGRAIAVAIGKKPYLNCSILSACY